MGDGRFGVEFKFDKCVRAVLTGDHFTEECVPSVYGLSGTIVSGFRSPMYLVSDCAVEMAVRMMDVDYFTRTVMCNVDMEGDLGYRIKDAVLSVIGGSVFMNSPSMSVSDIFEKAKELGVLQQRVR
jgi:hypothetical protein